MKPNDLNKLPNWAHWVARDSNGSWWAYEAEPHRHDNGWYENEIGRVQKIHQEAVREWKHD